MYRSLLLFVALFCTVAVAQAQYPLITIEQLQTVSGTMLSNCQDSSSYTGDTVRVRGVVMHHPDSTRYTQDQTGAQLWLQDSLGAFRGLDVIYFSDPSLIGMDALIQGDSVEITGEVLEYLDHETELVPLDGVQITVLGSTTIPPPTPVDICSLNDGNQLNQFATGEQYEGMYLELAGPLTVVGVTYFQSNERVSFQVQNAAGCQMNITDKFVAGNMAVSDVPGNFVPPNVFDVFDTIRGIMHHSPNGCTGQSFGRGYELSPMTYKDYVLNSASPTISTVDRTVATPNCNDSAVVNANISHPLGTPISKAMLYYATGVGSSSWDSVPMTNTSGNNWQGEIPGQADGTFVTYYVAGEDSAGKRTYNPNVPGQVADPEWYWTRCTGTEIYDVQFHPPSTVTMWDFNSGYEGMTVTVEGVVTASAEPGNLGYVYIQQENRLDWAGIMVTGSASLSNLKIGDKISVTAEVAENNGFTWLINAANITTNGTGTINAVSADPNDFTVDDYNAEAYEGMLVTLANAGGGSMWVVDTNADNGGNFGEYRVGSDQFDPAAGCRILAGRQTGSAFSSLNVSYVNDSIWATSSGNMNVSVCVVSELQTVDSITGVMNYSFNEFKLTPRNNDDFVGITPCAVSTDDPINAMRFVAYPNPAGGDFNLRFDGLTSTATAMIYDLTGRLRNATSLQNGSGEITFDSNNLASGTYFLKVVSHEGLDLYRQKIVITK